MSEAIKKMRDFLTLSPSVVSPDEVLELFEPIEEENAKLEKRLAQYGLFHEVVGDPAVEFASLRRELHRVERENDKLRELVRKMMRFFEDGDYCAACEKVAECDAQEEYDDDCLMRGVFHANIRELDVEVDK